MGAATRTITWLLLAAGCGLAGYWYGIGKGSGLMADLSRRVDAAEAFGALENSMTALAERDAELSRQHHEIAFRAALLKLGSSTQGERDHDCSQRERAIMRGANAYLVVGGQDPSFKAQRLVGDALKYCKP